MSEAREEVSNGIHNGQVEKKRRKGTALVALGIIVGLTFLAVLLIRAHTTHNSDVALCEKIDRFIVAAEKSTAADPDRTAAEKKAALKFYEDFRNDPPVCRTTP